MLRTSFGLLSAIIEYSIDVWTEIDRGWPRAFKMRR